MRTYVWKLGQRSSRGVEMCQHMKLTIRWRPNLVMCFIVFRAQSWLHCEPVLATTTDSSPLLQIFIGKVVNIYFFFYMVSEVWSIYLPGTGMNYGNILWHSIPYVMTGGVLYNTYYSLLTILMSEAYKMLMTYKHSWRCLIYYLEVNFRSYNGWHISHCTLLN